MSQPLSYSTVQLIEPVKQFGRSIRKPRHLFNLRHRPWLVQPFMIHPVLPGDTLEHMNVKLKAVTSPVKNPLLGWWLEHYFYYVPLRALESLGGETYGVVDGDPGLFSQMLLDPAGDVTAGDYYRDGSSLAAKPLTMRPANFKGYDFVQALLDHITLNYWRDERENALAPLIDGMPVASARMPGFADWSHSMVDKADVDAVDGDIYAPSELDAFAGGNDAYERWFALQEVGMTEVTYEDWLRDQGISVKEPETSGAPVSSEVLRLSRAFTTPAVTAGPDGSAAQRMIWDLNVDGLDTKKRRFFREPGFIVGCTTARAKVFFKNQTSPAVNTFMTGALAWVPKALSDFPALFTKMFAKTDGPLDQTKDWGETDDAYAVDLVDLFMHGDTFMNYANSVTDANLFDLPLVAMTKAARHYPSTTDIDSVFSGAEKLVHQDGICQMSIASRLRDTTSRS